jgi:hypothetical protein
VRDIRAAAARNALRQPYSKTRIDLCQLGPDAVASGDDERVEAADPEQMPGGGPGSGVVGGAHARDLAGLVVAVVDEYDRQATGVQGGDVLQGSLGLDHQQAVEGLGGDLGAELPHRLVAAVAGEQQQPVPLGLQHVDGALQDLADPRPGQRRHQHATSTRGDSI